MNTYGTTIDTVLIGRRDDEEWPHYLWSVTMVRNGVVRDKRVIEYRMGLGHEQTKCGKRRTDLRYNTLPCDHVRCHNAGWQPVPPTLYEVLCSLKADVTHGATFSDWCSDFGYDTDSIKARELYFACQRSEEDSRKFFGADWTTILDDEDYT